MEDAWTRIPSLEDTRDRRFGHISNIGVSSGTRGRTRFIDLLQQGFFLLRDDKFVSVDGVSFRHLRDAGFTETEFACFAHGPERTVPSLLNSFDLTLAELFIVSGRLHLPSKACTSLSATRKRRNCT